MLLAVVDNGSFSAAARAVRIPVATLSRRVSELEARLGARLLIRTTRKLTLTEAGIRYVARTRRMLEQLKEAEREAAGEFIEPRGSSSSAPRSCSAGYMWCRSLLISWLSSQTSAFAFFWLTAMSICWTNTWTWPCVWESCPIAT